MKPAKKLTEQKKELEKIFKRNLCGSAWMLMQDSQKQNLSLTSHSMAR